MTNSWDQDDLRAKIDLLTMELDSYRNKYSRLLEDLNETKLVMLKALERIQEKRDTCCQKQS